MHDELHTAAALDEDDMIIIWNSQELLQRRYRVVLHFLIGSTAMTDFDDAHPRVIEIEEFILNFLEDFQRHCRWTCIEIVHSLHISTSYCAKTAGKVFCHTNKKTPVPSKGRESIFPRCHPTCLSANLYRYIGRTRQIHHLQLQSGTPYSPAASHHPAVL